jgi:hypothetical protein
MSQTDDPNDERPIDNVDENAGVEGDAGYIDELRVPEGAED